MPIQTRSMTKKNSPVTKSPVTECLVTKSLVTKSTATKSSVTKSSVTKSTVTDSLVTNSMETNNPVSICSVTNCFQLERPKNYTNPEYPNIAYPEMISYITQEQYDSADFDQKGTMGGYKNGYFIAACIPKIKKSEDDDIYMDEDDPDYIKGKTIYAVAGKGYFWDLRKIYYGGYYYYLKKI